MNLLNTYLLASPKVTSMMWLPNKSHLIETNYYCLYELFTNSKKARDWYDALTLGSAHSRAPPPHSNFALKSLVLCALDPGFALKNWDLIRIRMWTPCEHKIQFAYDLASGGPRNLFWGPNQVFQSKVLRAKPESRARSARESRAKPESKAQSAWELRAKSELRAREKAREKAGEGVWGGGSVSPSPENFWKIELETSHFGAYLRQTFEINNMHGSRTCSIAHIHEQIDIEYLISGNCIILLKHKK